MTERAGARESADLCWSGIPVHPCGLRSTSGPLRLRSLSGAGSTRRLEGPALPGALPFNPPRRIFRRSPLRSPACGQSLTLQSALDPSDGDRQLSISTLKEEPWRK